MSAAHHLFRLLEHLEEAGQEHPKGTRQIAVDGRASVDIARRLGITYETAYELFEGVAVKEAFFICRWALAMPEEERIRALRAWKRRKGERRAAA